MKLAPKLILLFRDSDGFGSSIATALLPKPKSSITREESKFEISFEKYGVSQENDSCDLIQFIDQDGCAQVSILVMPNYAPPMAACAMNEILSLVTSQKFATEPTLVLPLISKSLIVPGIKLFGLEAAAKTDFSRGLIEKIAKCAPGLRIDSEPIACLMQMVTVLNLPTVLLIASSTKSSDSYHEGIFHIGDYLATNIDLAFNNESLKETSIEKGKGAQEPWRELYG